jgi:hypothetical protein
MRADRLLGYFIKLTLECILIFGFCAWYHWQFTGTNPNAFFWIFTALLFFGLRLLADLLLRKFVLPNRDK